MITAGANKGRVGVLSSIEAHPGSFGIAHLKDRRGNSFATRIGNVFVIGEGSKPWVSLPRTKGNCKLIAFLEKRVIDVSIADEPRGRSKLMRKTTP